MKSKHGASIKMNKEQSADDPSVDLIRVKNMLNSTISMSYPDVVIACIEHKVPSEAFRAIEAALWSTIIIWRISVGLINAHNSNHSNYLAVTEPTRSLSLVVKVVKLQLTYCNALVIKWIYNIVLVPEGRTRDVHSSSLFNWCICSLFWR